MNELIEKRISVQEAASVLGVSDEAVKKHIRELYPDLMRNGKATMLSETQITAIKRKMRPATKVAGSITDLEAADMLLKSAEHFKTRFEQERQARIEAGEKLAAAEPKAGYHDRLIDRKLLTNFRDTAKELGIPEKEFIALLESKKYIYRDGADRIKPYSDKMRFFAVKDFEKNWYAGNQTFITVEGKAHFLERFKKTVSRKARELCDAPRLV